MSSSFRPSSRVRRFVVFAPAVTATTMIAMVATGATAEASPPSPAVLSPGDLLVATSVFQNDPNIVAGTTQLPPGCGGTTVASPITLEELTPRARW